MFKGLIIKPEKMKNQNKEKNDAKLDITRKDALKKIGNYGKYAALTALGTYLVLSPQKSQAQSPATPGDGFSDPGGPGSGF